ncbi:MAG: ribosomal L7Ae/L30e/S12e/Gadd45 family protein [Candidatus Aenigmarchaeota archaeon]
MTIDKEIKKAMEEKKLVIGTKSVVKGIKKKDVVCVICPTNCREDLINDLNYYNKNFGIEIEKFKGNSRQLGEICGKPFNVMLLGIRK